MMANGHYSSSSGEPYCGPAFQSRRDQKLRNLIKLNATILEIGRNDAETWRNEPHLFVDTLSINIAQIFEYLVAYPTLSVPDKEESTLVHSAAYNINYLFINCPELEVDQTKFSDLARIIFEYVAISASNNVNGHEKFDFVNEMLIYFSHIKLRKRLLDQVLILIKGSFTAILKGSSSGTGMFPSSASNTLFRAILYMENIIVVQAEQTNPDELPGSEKWIQDEQYERIVCLQQSIERKSRFLNVVHMVKRVVEIAKDYRLLKDLNSRSESSNSL